MTKPRKAQREWQFTCGTCSGKVTTKNNAFQRMEIAGGVRLLGVRCTCGRSFKVEVIERAGAEEIRVQ